MIQSAWAMTVCWARQSELRLLVRPDTILRWHHNLLAGRHAEPHAITGVNPGLTFVNATLTQDGQWQVDPGAREEVDMGKKKGKKAGKKSKKK
jgi:hypothetical protein